MHHPTNGEQTIEVGDIQVRIGLRERMHGLVVVHRVARADELVGPSYVVDELPVVRGCSEGREVDVDGLEKHR